MHTVVFADKYITAETVVYMKVQNKSSCKATEKDKKNLEWKSI